MIIRSYTERYLIGRRTQSDRTADAIRLDGERNLIGRRTQSDRTANAIRSNFLIIYRVKLVFVTKHNLQLLLSEPLRHSRIAAALAEWLYGGMTGEAVVEGTCSWRGKYVGEALTEQIAKRDVAVMVETARHNGTVDEHANLIAQGVAEYLLLVVSGVLKVGPLEHIVVLDKEVFGKSPSVVTFRPRARLALRNQVENLRILDVVSALVP